MNPAPQFSKKCYRCDVVVRLTAEEFRADANEHTICPVCRAKLEIEAGFAGAPIEKHGRRRHAKPAASKFPKVPTTNPPRDSGATTT